MIGLFPVGGLNGSRDLLLLFADGIGTGLHGGEALLLLLLELRIGRLHGLRQGALLPLVRHPGVFPGAGPDSTPHGIIRLLAAI